MAVRRKVSHPLFVTSTLADTLDTNGSKVTILTSNSPIRISQHAHEITASLSSATLPADWGIKTITTAETLDITTTERTQTVVTSITIPEGNYRSTSELAQTINTLYDSTRNADFMLNHEAGSMELIYIRGHDNLKRWQLGCYLNTDDESFTPSSITLSATQADSPGICALFGFQSTDLSITITRPEKVNLDNYDKFTTDPPQAHLVYDANFMSYDTSSAYDNPLASVKAIYVQTNFTHGGRDADGNHSRILDVIPVPANITQGERFTFNSPLAMKTPMGHNMYGVSDHATLEIELLDQDGNAIVFNDPTTRPWTMEILLEWKETIQAERLQARDTETKFR